MIRNLIRSNETKGSESQNIENQRDMIKDIVSSNKKSESIIEQIDHKKNTSFVFEVTVEQLEKLSDLECYSNCFDHRKIIKFIKSRPDKVSCYVRYVDSEHSFYIDIEGIVIDEINNEIIMEFCRTFRSTNTNANFDPLAENHNEPHISYYPM